MHTPGRVERLRSAFDRLEVGAFVVTDLSSVRWLTGFTGSNGAVVITAEHMALVTDGRYTAQAGQQLEAAGVVADVVVAADITGAVADQLSGQARTAVEADHLTWAGQRKLDDAVDGTLVPTSGVLVRLRAVKDEGELDRIRRAAGITDAALAEVVPLLAERPTEREIALELDYGMQRRGATAPAYETIVASGPNGALPHARPTDRVIGAGDLVVIDVGALVDGYRSDMTRSFCVGAPTPEQERQLEVVRVAQAAGVAAVRGGVPAVDVDAACREVIAEAGWADAFSHGTGHGVGLDIHEQPRLNRVSKDTLEPGMLVTVEPGVYLVGDGGVRWEDLLHVTADGAENLSGAPKDPIVA